MSKNTLIIALGLIPLVLIITLVIIVFSQPKNGDGATIDTGIEISISPTNLPDPKETIRTFFNLINSQEIPAALELLSTDLTGTEAPQANSTLQAYAVSFSHWENAELISIAKTTEIDELITYMVVFDLSLTENTTDTLYIPGQNTRYFSLKWESDQYLISSIATGP